MPPRSVNARFGAQSWWPTVRCAPERAGRGGGVPTLSALANRSATESWSLTEELGASVEVESALIISGVDLADWSDIDMEVLRRVLVIVPLPGEPSYGWIETVVRCRPWACRGRGVRDGILWSGLVRFQGSDRADTSPSDTGTGRARRPIRPIASVGPDGEGHPGGAGTHLERPALARVPRMSTNSSRARAARNPCGPRARVPPSGVARGSRSRRSSAAGTRSARSSPG